jgi:hypothetical protein
MDKKIVEFILLGTLKANILFFFFLNKRDLLQEQALKICILRKEITKDESVCARACMRLYVN